MFNSIIRRHELTADNESAYRVSWQLVQEANVNNVLININGDTFSNNLTIKYLQQLEKKGAPDQVQGHKDASVFLNQFTRFFSTPYPLLSLKMAFEKLSSLCQCNKYALNIKAFRLRYHQNYVTSRIGRNVKFGTTVGHSISNKKNPKIEIFSWVSVESWSLVEFTKLAFFLTLSNVSFEYDCFVEVLGWSLPEDEEDEEELAMEAWERGRLTGGGGGGSGGLASGAKCCGGPASGATRPTSVSYIDRRVGTRSSAVVVPATHNTNCQSNDVT